MALLLMQRLSWARCAPMQSRSVVAVACAPRALLPCTPPALSRSTPQCAHSWKARACPVDVVAKFPAARPWLPPTLGTQHPWLSLTSLGARLGGARTCSDGIARLATEQPLAGHPCLPPPSSATFRQHVADAHQQRMVELFGDPQDKTPPSAAHVFYSCVAFESIFLIVNAVTLSPLVFEMFMPYHLKYTGFVLGWWGGTYLGLTVARYGPYADGLWADARTTVGILCMLTGVTSLVLADNLGNGGVWLSYWTLIAGYAGMAAFDLALHRRRMLPAWLARWKFPVSVLIVLSLLVGVLKGMYLESHAKELIMEAALAFEKEQGDF
eukprot:NODE_10077_length_1378_cov_5.165468.p1 GENE.NODE_10077_length_1378_cov_5.165468~~NODE_10077_length_1378_cov_5.165468.p1  ORF type:complete len:325 (-),score=56.60 NODE_10077_length_1378_cov_5.165468:294-1268(-)